MLLAEITPHEEPGLPGGPASGRRHRRQADTGQMPTWLPGLGDAMTTRPASPAGSTAIGIVDPAFLQVWSRLTDTATHLRRDPVARDLIALALLDALRSDPPPRRRAASRNERIAALHALLGHDVASLRACLDGAAGGMLSMQGGWPRLSAALRPRAADIVRAAHPLDVVAHRPMLPEATALAPSIEALVSPTLRSALELEAPCAIMLVGPDLATLRTQARALAASLGLWIVHGCVHDPSASAWIASLPGTENALLWIDDPEESPPEPGRRAPVIRAKPPASPARRWVVLRKHAGPGDVIDMDLVVQGPSAPRPSATSQTLEHLVAEGISPLLPESIITRLAELHVTRPECAQLAALAPLLADDAPDEGAGNLYASLRRATSDEIAAMGDRLVRVIEERRQALGAPVGRGSRTPGEPLALPWSAAFVSPSTSFDRMVSGLRQSPRAAMLFTGASGTGKSQAAIMLARQLGCSTVKLSAADFSGVEAQRRLHRAFATAEQTGAIVIVDALELLASERRRTFRPGDLSVFHEFLAALDGYSGTVIGITALPYMLDVGASRRFPLTVTFRSVPRASRRLALQHLLVAFEVSFEEEQLTEWACIMEQWPTLHVGDLHAAAATLRFQWPQRGDDVVAAVDEAIAARGAHTKTM
jgi:hypothetical protein